MKAILTSLLILCSLPLAFAVDLEWDPNLPEDNVLGYNIYRSLESGTGYGRLNQQLITLTTYSDDTVETGLHYYYVATAVNANGESGFSNEVDYQTFCLGDANGSGSITIADAVTIQNHLLGIAVLSGPYLIAADANGNGMVTIADAVRIQNHLLGIEALPPCP